MWISTEEVAFYIEVFQENGWRLTKGRFGWNLFDPSTTRREEFLDYDEFLSSELLKTQMPKTYALIKQELERDNRN